MLLGILVVAWLLAGVAGLAAQAVFELGRSRAVASAPAQDLADAPGIRMQRKLDRQMLVGVHSPEAEARRSVLLRQARSLMARQAYTPAIERLETLIEMAPQDHVGLDLLARCLLGAGRISRARVVADQAIAANPLTLSSRRTRARIQLESGQLEGALADLSLVLTHQPSDAEARVERAQLYEQRGEVHRALADWQAALGGAGSAGQKARCRDQIDRLVSRIMRSKRGQD